MNQKDIIGKKFDKLTIKLFLGYEIHYKQRRRMVLCKCECGKEKKVILNHVLTGHLKSCGCLVAGRTKHGLSGTRFWVIWKSLFKRCNNKKQQSYKYYGANGIKVSNNWKRFINFKNDMYESYLEHVKEFGEKNTTLDRRDNNKGYEFLNCKWATQKEQARNKTSNRILQIRNEKMCISAWAEKRKIKENTIRSRLSRGWTPEQALQFET